MNQIDFPRPHVSKPKWGVIIVTGVTAAAVVIFAGIFISQISLAFDSDVTSVPSVVPTATLAEPKAAYALQVQHRGEWVMHVTVTSPGHEPRSYMSSGEGLEISLPYYQASAQETVNVEGEFIVYITYPIFDGTGRTGTGSRRYGSHEDYTAAMKSHHYMLYDKDNNILFIRDEQEMKQYYQDVPVTIWQP
ncbi:MAG: hypothetical protein KJ064_17985 [Anaerolineae bacterium]|nr:hypothetical protein [Anaerolineae bacterium]